VERHEQTRSKVVAHVETRSGLSIKLPASVSKRVRHDLFRSTRSMEKELVATIDSFLESIVGISKGSKGPR